MSQPRLTGHFAKIGDFLRELYAIQDLPSLHQTITAGLGDLVAGDNIFIGEHDMENTRITGCAARHLFETPDFLPIVNSCVGEHPLWEAIRTGDQITRCISDHASARKWEATTLYQEALGKEGIRDHLSIEFGKRTRRLTSVGVFRGRRGFSSRDHETMSFLIPHLSQAFDNAKLVEENGWLKAGHEEAGIPGVIHLDADAMPDARWLAMRGSFERFFPGQRFQDDQLPQEVACWVAAGRELLDRGALERHARPFIKYCADHRLELRLLRQRQNPGYLLTVRCPSTSALGAVRLTPRETEVLHWLREGKRNEEIGIILGMGVTTVKTHLKHIYQKLGVESRTAAVRVGGG